VLLPALRALLICQLANHRFLLNLFVMALATNRKFTVFCLRNRSYDVSVVALLGQHSVVCPGHPNHSPVGVHQSIDIRVPVNNGRDSEITRPKRDEIGIIYWIETNEMSVRAEAYTAIKCLHQMEYQITCGANLCAANYVDLSSLFCGAREWSATLCCVL
jgi:hypothetical protein